MSAKVKPMKAVSHKASLSKIVKLLIGRGIDVRFRGVQPYVASVGNTAKTLVLPEINDNAPPELMKAIHGFLDHEVGHILFTPFGRATRFSQGDARMGGLVNILEDIRLEKLLPRELPGTRENLEKMYEATIPTMFDPPIRKVLAQGDPAASLSALMVVAFRAMSGQQKFREYMDANDFWPMFEPLTKRMPNLEKDLAGLEEFADVERLATEIMEVMAPPKKEDDADDQSAPPPASAPQAPPPPPSPPQPTGDDEDEDDDDCDGGGSGKGDGKGTDSDPDQEDEGKCSGDGDEDGDGDDDSDKPQQPGDRGDKGVDEDGEDDSDRPGDTDEDSDDADDGADEEPSNDGSYDPAGSGDGKTNRTITDALKLLEPAQRRALFLYKKRKKTVSDIAVEMKRSEDAVRDLLRKARRRLNELMNGDK